MYRQVYGDPFLSVMSIFSSIVSVGRGSLPCILKISEFFESVFSWQILAKVHQLLDFKCTRPRVWLPVQDGSNIPCHIQFLILTEKFNQSLQSKGKIEIEYLVTMNGCSRSLVYFGRTASSFMRQRFTKWMKSIVKMFSTPLLLDVS